MQFVFTWDLNWCVWQHSCNTYDMQQDLADILALTAT